MSPVRQKENHFTTCTFCWDLGDSRALPDCHWPTAQLSPRWLAMAGPFSMEGKPLGTAFCPGCAAIAFLRALPGPLRNLIPPAPGESDLCLVCLGVGASGHLFFFLVCLQLPSRMRLDAEVVVPRGKTCRVFAGVGGAASDKCGGGEHYEVAAVDPGRGADACCPGAGVPQGGGCPQAQGVHPSEILSNGPVKGPAEAGARCCLITFNFMFKRCSWRWRPRKKNSLKKKR